MYKSSQYNLTVEELENGNKVIYNTYTGAFAIFDHLTQKIYENINLLANIEELTKEEIDTISNLKSKDLLLM